MAEELQLALLGNLQIRRDSVPVTGLGSGKAQALLCYLAVTGRPHLRPTLVGLLWGAMPEANARNNLSKALTQLRQVVGQHLTITHQAVAFDRASPYWLDVEIFEARVSGVSTAGTSAQVAASRPDIERLQSAIELYRGDFLEGFHVRRALAFEEWVLAQRARLRELALQILHTLAVYHTGQGEAGRAAGIDYATRLLALEPWREEAHRQLMLLLARSGQRSAALAQYQTCCQVLAEELDVEPAEETVALYEQIRAGKLKVPIPIREVEISPRLPVFLDGGAERRELTRPTFVARERELERLNGFLKTALTGEGRVVFVIGDPGSGKTALVGEYARRAQAEHPDLVVAGGNCNAYTGIGDPYLPFREILGQLTGDVESRWAAGAISTEGARRLWHQAPLAIQSLVETGPGLIGVFLAASPLAARAATAPPGGADWRDQLETHPVTDKAGRGRADLRRADLHAQLAALLTALAQQYPLLLTVDDLQWADAGTIDLLFHLGRRLAGSRILIAGIYRPTEVALGRDGERHPLAPLIHEFQRQFGPIEVDLAQSGDRQFVEAFLDSEPNRLGHSFRQALYQRTGGHALYTVETLRDMQERWDLVQDEAGRWVERPAVDWASLPVRVEGVIAERIERLPTTLREILAVASVEGEAFTAEVVARVRGSAEAEIVGQLSGELDRRHRLVVSEGSRRAIPGGQRASRYRFRHILFQEYVYGGLDETQRAYLHEAVGNALEQLHAGQEEAVAVQLARHYHAAGRMGKAAVYALQAGDQACRLYVDSEARQHYAQALSALAGLPDTVENRRRRVDALFAHASCSGGTDSLERNLARLGEAEQLAQGLPGPDGRPGGDRLRLGYVRLGMGRAHYLHGALREAIAYYERVLSLARELGDIGLIARSSYEIGEVLIMQGHCGRAEALLGQAIPLFERMGQWPDWCRALSCHGGTLVMRGNYAAGFAEIQSARARAQEMNELSVVMYNNYFLNAAYIMGGNLPRAIEISRQMVALAERADSRLDVYIGCYHQVWAASRAGQYEAAAAHAARAQAMAREIGERLPHDDHLVASAAEIAYGAGRVQDAIALAEQAVGIAQEMGGVFAGGMARRTWGQALAALVPPQWDEAEAQLAQSLRLLEEGQSRLEAARTRVAWGAVCRDREDLAAARAHWERAAAQWERSGLTHELERARALIESLTIEQ